MADSVPIVKWFFIALLALSAGAAASDLDIQASGLFRDRAILTIGGESRLLRVGEISPEGVKLVASDSSQAVIEIDGEREVLTLSGRIAATFSQAEVAEVRIQRGADSHYSVWGTINGRNVEMLVDTGASAVAMNSGQARRLGIDYENGQPGIATTASGRVDTRIVTLNRVSIGNISVDNVSAVVIEGDYPPRILLGNSLLSRIEMSEESGVLVLRQKY